MSTAAGPDAPEAEPGRRRWGAEVAAAAACAAVGLLISILPHLIWWPEVGEPVWIANYDEFGMYLPIVAQAYQNHPTRLGDPARAEPAPNMYPWVQFVPAVLTARALGLGPAGVSLIWRVWAGLSIGLVWYLLVRHYVGRPWASAAIASALVCDVGVFSGHVLINPVRILARSLALPAGPVELPYIHTLWRLVTPALSFAPLWLHVWLLARARDVPSRGRILASGAGFGLLFHVYFYFWTAAGLGLVLAWLLDAGRRRVYFHTAWIGGLIGLPAVIAGMALKSGLIDWQHRTDNFLPIARLSELVFPKIALVGLPIMLAWVMARRRDLVPLWALACAGLLLMNHQVASGLQIQNFHWGYVWGPALSLLMVLLVWGELARRLRPAVLAWGLGVLAVFEVGDGLWLRAVEATRSQQAVSMMATYRAYRDQRLAPGVVPLAPNAVVAGSNGFANAAAILENQRPLAHYVGMYSRPIGEAEWAERLALNAVLGGEGRSGFEAQQLREMTHGWGPWFGDRNPSLRAEELARRLRFFDAITADPVSAARRFGVRYAGVTAGSPTPDALRRGWKLIQDGPGFRIWEIEDREPGGRQPAPPS